MSPFLDLQNPSFTLNPSVPPILHPAQTPIPCLPGNGFTAGPHGRVSTRHQTAKSTCWGAPCLPWGEHGRWTLQVRNGTPGCDGLCSAGSGYRKCEIPRTKPGSIHDHLLEFKPSFFWGLSLSHFPKEPIHLNPVTVYCLILLWSLNIIVLTGQRVEQWVIRKTVTTCGHPQWP